MNKVDITPTWAALLPVLIEVAANGATAQARRDAHAELMRLAKTVDEQNAEIRANEASVAQQKQCTMNCGPALGDTRSEEQRKAECTDCITIDVAVPDPEPAPVLSGDALLYTMRAMAAFGGGFANHIAAALSVADTSNSERIQRAMPGLMAKYGPGSDFYNAMESASEH